MKDLVKLLKNAKDLDPYVPVLALNANGYATDYMAGEIGEGACFLLRDLENVLSNAVPRTEEELFEFIADSKLTILWIDSLLDNSRKLVISSMDGFELYESDYERPFDASLSNMLRDGINFILDMEEEDVF